MKRARAAKPVWYTVYRAKDDVVLAIGTVAMCARAMCCTENCFHSRVSRVKSGQNKTYCIVAEDLETGSFQIYGGEKKQPFQWERIGKEGLVDKLYADGLSDVEIAKELGVNTSAIAYWRRKNGMPANNKKGRPKKGIA